MSQAKIIVGLGYGDEGKGTVADYLCKAEGRSLVVRYNGGSQAAHNVVTDDGRHHTFSQIGSGTFQGAGTLLSRYMMVDPISLAIEAIRLSPKLSLHALSHHYVDARAPVITPFHGAANRVKEWLRKSKHGSCGMGIGELAEDLLYNPMEVIRVGDLARGCSDTLKKIQARKRALFGSIELGSVDETIKDSITTLLDPRVITEIDSSFRSISEELNILNEDQVNDLLKKNSLLFEGAQGVGLDEWHGFHPYTTWSTTTQFNALKVLEEAGIKDFETVGILRSYSTRHGAGPFVTEDASMSSISPKEHNRKGLYQGSFRSGPFDAVLTRYTSGCVNKISPLTGVAVTHMDLFEAAGRKYCDSYVSKDDWPYHLKPRFDKNLDAQEKMGADVSSCSPLLAEAGSSDEFLGYVGKWCHAPVSIISCGPATADKVITECRVKK